jgi:hypothetical protein
VYILLLFAFLLYRCDIALDIAQYHLYLSQDKGHCFINIFEHSSFVRKYLNHPYICMFSLCISFCSLPFSCTDAILHNTVYISLKTKDVVLSSSSKRLKLPYLLQDYCRCHTRCGHYRTTTHPTHHQFPLFYKYVVLYDDSYQSSTWRTDHVSFKLLSVYFITSIDHPIHKVH